MRRIVICLGINVLLSMNDGIALGKGEEKELDKVYEALGMTTDMKGEEKEALEEKNHLKEDYNKMAEEYLKPHKIRGTTPHQRKELPQKQMDYDTSNHQAEQDKAVTDQKNINLAQRYLRDPSRMLKRKVFQPSQAFRVDQNKYQGYIEEAQVIDQISH